MTIKGLKNAFKCLKVLFDVSIPKCTTHCGALVLGLGWLWAGLGYAWGDSKPRSQVVGMGGSRDILVTQYGDEDGVPHGPEATWHLGLTHPTDAWVAHVPRP